MISKGNPLISKVNPLKFDGNPLNFYGNPLKFDGNPLKFNGNPLKSKGNPMDSLPNGKFWKLPRAFPDLRFFFDPWGGGQKSRKNEKMKINSQNFNGKFKLFHFYFIFVC